MRYSNNGLVILFILLASCVFKNNDEKFDIYGFEKIDTPLLIYCYDGNVSKLHDSIKAKVINKIVKSFKQERDISIYTYTRIEGQRDFAEIFDGMEENLDYYIDVNKDKKDRLIFNYFYRVGDSNFRRYYGASIMDGNDRDYFVSILELHGFCQ
ncbi:hypothetical protein GCM10009117_07110 [Gangjinia marincola]|uniref:Lipoprotein n=1 Tax=Gangjinia marincola TaxID=578463 RepID=A0ABP3XQI3_9FLAO